MLNLAREHILDLILFFAFLFCVISFFDKALAVGLLALAFLAMVTVFAMRYAGMEDEKIYTVFFLALAVHLAAVLVIYYGQFKPFGGGADYEGYNQIAIELARRFSQWNFSLAGLYTDHFFPVLIGIIYLFTLPGMIVGQLFTVWLAAISIALVYRMVLEIGGTAKAALFAVAVSIFYPSYLYFGSVLLKDTVVIPLVLLGVLLIISMVKRFSWLVFLLFFTVLTGLINLRFYVGYALLLSCLVSWPILSTFALKKRMAYWALMIVLLGLPSYLVGNGYYGSDSFSTFLNPKSITYYREIVYGANSPLNPKPVAVTPVVTPPPNPKPVAKKPPGSVPSAIQPAAEPVPVDTGSTFVLETGFNKGIFTFLKNSFLSFIYSLLGPFPWQFTHARQVVGLAETIPWYILLVVCFCSGYRFIKKKGWGEFFRLHRFSLPLLFFAVLGLGALALFINNYGIIARIRIPMFLCFVCVMFLTFNHEENLFTYWRGRIYRLPFVKGAFGGRQ